MTYFVCEIHNNEIGRTVEVSNYDEGVTLVKKLARKYMGSYDLGLFVLEEIENTGMFKEGDTCYTIGILE